MAYQLIVAEKPSVARDIARVVGAKGRQEGYYDGETYRVTWALGHLVSLMEPEEIDEKWKRWRAEDLPILPAQIPLKVLPKTKKQYTIVKRLMRDKECMGIICATDAGREGELIFRYIYRMAACPKPVRRFWISSMTDEAIREGFAGLKPGEAYDLLYESARCRAEADWLVGMNASRAYTLRYDALLPIGRVQTPTLALLVRRRREIEAFTPEAYWTVTAHFGDYTGLWLDEKTGEKRLYDGRRAEAIAAKVRGKDALVESVARETKKEWPPNLYDLTALQRDANRLLGFTAKKTLETAQKLYEEYKLLTYPRTDSRYLPRDMAGRTRQAMEGLPEAYAGCSAPLLAQARLPMVRRVFDDTKVGDHHAIIPTGKRCDPGKLPPDAAALFDLVARRLLAAFYPEHCYDAVRVIACGEGEPFVSVGREVSQEGWKAVYRDMPSGKRKKAEKREDEETRLPKLSEGDVRTIQKAAAREDKTKPPAPHTDASLLAAMEHAGREIEDEALRESMKGSGLGTPATRAAIMERLLAVQYAERRGRAITATDKGVRLIAAVPADIASPETTGRWEKALSDIVSGGMQPERFLSGIRRLASSLVDSAKTSPADIYFEREERKGRGGSAKRSAAIGAVCPLCGQGALLENSKAYYCARYRDGCKLTIWKDCVVRAGGPELSPALMKRLLAEGKVRGSTGTIRHAGGVVRFEKAKLL
ncbi:MAG: DNA topoisomerase 3 [Firmicutes bacterium]|nr:DNA topoisomerase 3 [Bacillota bacterium]